MIAAARFFPTIVDSGTALTDTVIFLFQGPPNSSIWWWNWNWRKWRYAERWSKSTSVSRQGCLPGLNHFKCCKHTFHSACFCCCCCCCCLILYLFFRVPKGILWLYLVLSYHFFVTRLIKKSLHFLNPSQFTTEAKINHYLLTHMASADVFAERSVNLKIIAPSPRPTRIKAKSNRDLLMRFFPAHGIL